MVRPDGEASHRGKSVEKGKEGFLCEESRQGEKEERVMLEGIRIVERADRKRK